MNQITAEEWQVYCSLVEKLEKQYWEKIGMLKIQFITSSSTQRAKMMLMGQDLLMDSD
jgi:hypothetical protein